MSSRLALAVLASAGLLVGVPSVAAAAPATHWVVAGPELAADVRLGPDGGLTLAVARGGREVLAPAPLGLYTEGADLSRGLRFTGSRSRTVVEHYTMTTGKRRDRTARMTERRRVPIRDPRSANRATRTT